MVRILVLVVILLATALRFYGLGSKSLWGDEIAQAVWSAWDWAQLWREFRAPPDFLSHFVLVHLAQLLGREEFWTRFPSAVTSLLAVPLTYVLAKRLTDRVTGLVAMALMAVAPYQIWYAQEARMYAALGCYAVLSLYFFVRLVDEGGRPAAREWLAVVGLVVGNTLAIYTHLFGVFPILAEGVAAAGILGAGWIRNRRATLPRWAVLVAISFGLTILLALPLLPGTVPYVVQGAKPAVAENIAPTPPFQLSNAFVWELLGDIGLGAREGWRTTVSLAAVLGLIALTVRKPRAGWIAAVWLLLPLMVLAITQPRHGVSARYLIFLQPVYLILIAYAAVQGAKFVLMRLSKGSAGRPSTGRFSLGATVLVLGGILVLGIVVAPPLAELYPRAKLNDWRAIARYIEDNSRAGDLVFGERNTPNMNALTYYIPNLLRYTTPPTTLDALAKAKNENRRLWYISVGEFFDPEGEAWARENLAVVPLTEWLDPSLQYAPASAFEYTQSEHLATLYFRDGALPSEIVYVGRQGFANENVDRVKMDPGETLEAEMELVTAGARVLEIEFSSKKAAVFDVMVDGALLAQVREAEADKGTETVRWELPVGGKNVAVRVLNLSAEFPLFIRRLSLRADE